MMGEKEKIDNEIFIGKSSFVTVSVKGTKQIEKIQIDNENLEKEDIEMLEDILVVAINDAMNQIDKETEKRMGKYTQGMPGLF
jgi:hypothetical protein